MIVHFDERGLMELLQFRYFMTAAKYENMTKAAEELHIAQPALSQSIKRLETELGVELFDRSRHRIALNEHGRLLEKKLRPILHSIDGLQTELQESQYTANHLVRLNLMAASSYVTTCIIDYKAIHPDVSFILSQKEPDELIDINVTSMIGSVPLSDRNTVVLEEEFFMAVPASSRFAAQPYIRLSDMAHEDFISLDKSRLIRAFCDAFCQSAGFTPHIIFESDNPESVKNLTGAGLGIAFWPIKSWGELNTKSAVLLPIRDPVCRRSILLTIYDHGWKNPAVRDFYRFLCTYSQTGSREG